MTQVSGYITDGLLKTGIPNATIDLALGNLTLKRVAADDKGGFSIQSDSDADRMIVSSVGYQTKEFKMPDFAGYFSFELTRNVKPLPGVTVTTTFDKKNAVWLLLLVGLLIAAKNKS